MAIVATGEMAVTPDLKGFESKMNSSLGGIAKKAALAFGGAFAATKAVDFLGSAIADARESNKVAAQTAAAIKSTGGAANVTAKQVDALANSISRKTGIDDEQIAKASNLLLTFTNIKNAAGENNDIFNQATKIAADMGAALGTDAAGSAIQLGKALNDPIKGISALTRVGVTFSDAQKEQIKRFVETGDVASAQKVILAELAKEFGGSAAAQATAADKLKVTLGNLKEDLGNKLIPIIDKFATFLANNLPGALDAAGKAFSTISKTLAPVVKGFVMFFNTLRTGFTEDEGTGVERFALRVRDVLKTLVDAFQKTFRFVMDNKEVLVGFGAAIAAILVPAFIAWATAAGAAAIATIAAAAPVIAVAAAIGVLVAGLVYAYNHWTGFREVIQAVVSFVTESLIPALGNIVSAIGKVISWVKDHWPLLLTILTGPIGIAVGLIVKHFDKVKAVAEGVANAIKAAFKAVFNAIASVWNATVGKLSFKVPSWVPGIGGKGFDVPDIPTMHDGGVFQAPFGRKEGLALLQSGETVFPKGMIPISVSVIVNGQVTPEAAYAAGRAAGRGIEDEMARTELRRAARAR